MLLKIGFFTCEKKVYPWNFASDHMQKTTAFTWSGQTYTSLIY